MLHIDHHLISFSIILNISSVLLLASPMHFSSPEPAQRHSSAFEVVNSMPVEKISSALWNLGIICLTQSTYLATLVEFCWKHFSVKLVVITCECFPWMYSLSCCISCSLTPDIVDYYHDQLQHLSYQSHLIYKSILIQSILIQSIVILPNSPLISLQCAVFSCVLLHQVSLMGNNLLVDSQPICILDILNLNAEALVSFWDLSTQPAHPLLFRMWRLCDAKQGVHEEHMNFLDQSNMGLGFSRNEAYICLTLVNTQAPIDPSDRVPYFARMFLESVGNLGERLDAHVFRKHWSHFILDITLLKGKRLSPFVSLKALSLHAKLEFKFRHASDNFIHALFTGASLHNNKLVKTSLSLLPHQGIQCPVTEIHDFPSKCQSLPLFKQLHPVTESRFCHLPIDKGINYWQLFTAQTPSKPEELFHLDITGIHPHENNANLSDFDHQLDMGMKEHIEIINHHKLGDMSLSMLNELKPVIKFVMPDFEASNDRELSEKRFYMLCKEKDQGVDIVMWEGQEWSRDSTAQGEFMEQIIGTHFKSWPADKIYLHERGYKLD